MLKVWAGVVTRHAGLVLVLGVSAIVAAAVFGLGVFGALSEGGFEDPNSESSMELAAERANFPSHDADVVVIYSSPDLTVDDALFKQSVEAVVASLPAQAVDRVESDVDTPERGLVSEDGHATMVLVSLAGDSDEAKTTNYDTVKPLLSATGGLTTDIGGPWAVFGDVNDTVSADIARAETLALPIVFVLCLVIFGSVVAALMPGLVGAAAVLGAFAVVRLITMVTDVSIFSINVITLIGMGLAIDYALFIVSRFREELARQPGTERHHVNAAVLATMTTAGRTVLFSGLTVAASLASLLIFPQNFLRSMGLGGVAAVSVAMVAALTVLPALLTVLGRRVDSGRMPWRRGTRRELVTDTSGLWARIGHSVMQRPVAYLVVIVVSMLALGAPFLNATWGSVDERVLPADAPSRVTADLQAAEFGGERSTANIVVEGADAPEVSAYLTALGRVDGVESVRPIDQSGSRTDPVTLVQVTWPGNAQTSQSQQLVSRLRDVRVAGGARVLVGGASAQAVDLIDSIIAHLPWMGLIVVAVMLVLLFLAFGSVVLPVKAVVMNAVSITASFGVVTWIFQDGHLSGLLGFSSPGYLDATQPILMLAILFGLSMDYEVFLLSRVREEWDRTHDNTAAVAIGLQRTGRIITSAALLLAVVIGGFATSGIVFLKMIGIGMLVAVLLDATVVRALLVPATMRLLGTSNWWAPGPLRRWWDRHGIREGDPAPAGAVPRQGITDHVRSPAADERAVQPEPERTS
ncbi:MAG: MMPL family transporter [Propionibacteriales bacterium]|nr:MMPL family transporter [Propionibacteriales bacterium]